jgi:hypothetical protein
MLDKVSSLWYDELPTGTNASGFFKRQEIHLSKQHKVAAAAFSDLEGVKAKLEEARDELSEAMDGKSEKWLESEKGEKTQAELDALESAIDSIESAMGSLDEVKADE